MGTEANLRMMPRSEIFRSCKQPASILELKLLLVIKIVIGMWSVRLDL